MNYQIYSDETLSEVVAVAHVGVWRKVDMYLAHYQTPTWTIGSATINGRWSVAYSSTNTGVIKSGEYTSIFKPSNIDIKNTDTRQYFYIASNLRVRYYLWKESGETTLNIWNPSFEIKQGNNWNACPGTAEIRVYNISEFVGFRLNICKAVDVKVHTTGADFNLGSKDALCLDVVFKTTGQTDNTTYISCAAIAPIEDITINDEEQPYKPTQVSRSGGKGFGYYPDDGKESINAAGRNAAFTFAGTDGKGLTYYKISTATYLKILSKIYDKSFFKQGVDANFGLKDAVVAMYKIPRFPAIGSDIPICLGSYQFDDAFGKPFLDRFVSAEYVQTINLRDLEDYGWEDFSDFKNTKMSLYLPFVGRINLDTHWFAQGVVCVEWLLDCYNGNIIYWVSGRNLNRNELILYGTYSGNCAVQVPWGGSINKGMPDAIENISGALGHGVMSIVQASAGLGSGSILSAGRGAVGLAQSASELISSAYQLSQAGKSFLVDKSGVVDPKTVTGSPYQCVLQIEMPNQVRPINWTELQGISGNISGTIQSFSGFTVFSEVKLNLTNATDAEKREIIRLLKEGVFLPKGSV